MKQEELVPLFMPALSTLLISAEDKKGSPLDENDVLKLRDNASVIMVQKDHAQKMEKSRGYKDVDPENVWYDWQMLRRKLGRKPDIDPGARFSFLNSKDDEFKKSILQAQNTLSEFRAIISEKADFNLFPLIKVLLSEEQYRAYMWLIVRTDNGNGFEAEIFELPSDFKCYKVGQKLSYSDDEIQDWMINDSGTLYGGFSLRYSREKMSKSEQMEFDQHIGVEKYA